MTSTRNHADPEERRTDVAGIQTLVVEPARPPSRLVVWLSHLGGDKERELPQLRALAGRGARAVSCDAPDHGERAAGGDPRAYAEGVLAEFRWRMWPLLGQTTLEALRVIDATIDPGIRTVAAGGVSMGGDIAIALAGIDPRIERVATIGSTPDWTRPGMTRLDDPATELEQGDPDSYGRWLRDQLDPAIHLERYRRGVTMRLHRGECDHHVPRANARAVARALTASAIEIVEHPGLDHWGVCSDEAALADCVGFLAAS